MPVTVSALNCPNRILLGTGAGEHVPDVIHELGCEKPLLVTDTSLTEVGVVSKVEGWLAQGEIEATIWDGVEPEPSTDSVLEAIEICKSSNCDSILGVGGGSALDSAKAVSILVRNGGAVKDYLGNEIVERRGLPTVMMPTTAGTGAEVTQNALFHVEEENAKEAIISKNIIPDAAIIEPRLTLSLPPKITAITGFDALCHAIECYTGRNASQFVYTFAIEAIRLIATSLRTAVHDGANLAAREAMATASLYGGLAIISGGTNGVHALAYPLQGLHRVPHGLANAMLLPHVMEFNLAADVGRFADVASALGVPTEHLSVRDAAEAGAVAVRKLATDIELPQSFGDLGIDVKDIPEMVKGALEVQRLLINNPRDLTAEDAETIYSQLL